MIDFYIRKISLILVIIGAINWGFTSFGYNIVDLMVKNLNNTLNITTYLDKVIYIIIALSAMRLTTKDVFVPSIGKTEFPSSLISLKENKFKDDKIIVKVSPNKKVVYWASKNFDKNKVPDLKTAYGDYSNSGVVMSDKEGYATLTLKKGRSYYIPFGNKVKPHLHYRYELEPNKFSKVYTYFF